jgi:hypothetical protein
MRAVPSDATAFSIGALLDPPGAGAYTIVSLVRIIAINVLCPDPGGAL